MIWIVACAEVVDSGPKESTVTTGWYVGESVGQTPDGSYVADPEATALERILDPDASTVTENVWASGEASTLTHTVDGNTFSSTWTFDGATLQTEGAFDAGDAWAWTAWHSTTTWLDGADAGSRLESTDQLSADAAHADKVYYDADGVDVWHIAEDLAAVSEEEFDAAVGR